MPLVIKASWCWFTQIISAAADLLKQNGRVGMASYTRVGCFCSTCFVFELNPYSSRGLWWWVNQNAPSMMHKLSATWDIRKTGRKKAICLRFFPPASLLPQKILKESELVVFSNFFPFIIATPMGGWFSADLKFFNWHFGVSACGQLVVVPSSWSIKALFIRPA